MPRARSSSFAVRNVQRDQARLRSFRQTGRFEDSWIPTYVVASTYNLLEGS